MSFAPSDECRALVDSAARVVRDHYDYPALRATLASPPGMSPVRWREFAALGWLAAPLAEDAGGLGLPPSVASALASALGPAAMSEPLPGQLAYGAALLGAAAPGPRRDAVLARFLAGEALVALVDGSALEATPTAAGVRLAGRVDAVLDGGIADVFVVATRTAAGAAAHYLVDAAAAGLAREAHHGPDGRSFATVTLTGVTAAADAQLALEPAAVAAAHTLFALLLASETLGIMQALVTVTGAYLAQREQFGRKLIEFQVLQHRLVDMHLERVRVESLVELAGHHCDSAGLAAAAPTVSAAFYLAARCGRRVGEEAVQLHGAIGMTDELVVGHYLKRIVANGLLAGHAEHHLAQAAHARGIVPPTE